MFQTSGAIGWVEIEYTGYVAYTGECIQYTQFFLKGGRGLSEIRGNRGNMHRGRHVHRGQQTVKPPLPKCEGGFIQRF